MIIQPANRIPGMPLWRRGRSSAGVTPVSRWNFEEGSGTTANDSIGSNNGTISSATYVTGHIGSYALDFDGSNDYVTLTSVPTYITDSHDFTFTFWVKVTSVTAQPSNERIVYMCESTTTERVANIALRGEAGYNTKVFFAVRTNGSASQKTICLTNPLTVNTWTFVACIWNASAQTVTMYMNDAVLQSGTETQNLGSTDIAMRFGTRSTTTDSTDMLDGSIDDIRLYQQLLSTSEISAIYNE